jgi:hypothetical protein
MYNQDMMSKNFPLQNKMEAQNRGVHNNVLLKINGGLGDIVCAEPAIRFAIDQFKGINWSIQTANPEFFTHLNLKIIPLKEKINEQEYLVLEGVQRPENLIWQFLSHMTTHCVDYWGMGLFGWQLPDNYKTINLPPYSIKNKDALHVSKNAEDFIVIHAGKHFPSKTFSPEYWDTTIKAFKDQGFKICLVGKTVDEHCGYVKTTEVPDVDLRDKLSLTDFSQLLVDCKYLYSNDSAAIHIAAAGDAFIGFIASIKHEAYITHYRNKQFGYKSKNFAKGYLGDYTNINFNNCKLIELNSLPSVIVQKLLPNPLEVANFYKELKNASI